MIDRLSNGEEASQTNTQNAFRFHPSKNNGLWKQNNVEAKIKTKIKIKINET